MTLRVACVVAHPDDDTYAVGGSLALHAGEDLEITVLVSTSGEEGLIADPSLATRETLAGVREAEDRASWTALGLEPQIHFLRHPDGGLMDVPREDLVAAYVETLIRAEPQVVVTFGPDGITGHEDHVAVGAATTEAFRISRDQASGGFERLLHTAIPASDLDRFNELLRARGLEPWDPTQPFAPRGVPDERVDAVVDCSSVWERKREALRCHRTQAELEDLPSDLWPVMLGRECFTLAWPERDPAHPVLADLFEGLPAS